MAASSERNSATAWPRMSGSSCLTEYATLGGNLTRLVRYSMLSRLRNGAREAAPRSLDLHRRRGSIGLRVEMDPHRGEMSGVVDRVERRGRREVAGENAHPVDRSPVQLVVDRAGGAREAFRGGEGDLERRADRKTEVGLDAVGGVEVAVEDDDPHRLGADEEERDEDDDDREDEGQPHVADGPRHGRHHDPVPDVVQPVANPVLKGAERWRAPGPVVREVGGEDEETLRRARRRGRTGRPRERRPRLGSSPPSPRAAAGRR